MEDRVRALVERRLAAAEARLFDGMDVGPRWLGKGKLGWRWRALLAARALLGYELGGFE
jgi:hypothetical protein